ncbi:MAG: NAD(P)-dependent alcohol dehydrogenase, partial [Xanthomonadales bacterium]|nr:NAD(P)-dependent alcohol dehydrogenase [Xanthomonadales bacterium]
MKLRYKFGIGFLAVLVVAVAGAMITLSYESDCPPPGEGFDGPGAMQAWRYYCYGGPEVLRLEDVERPAVGADQVLVRVHAAGVNPYDWHFMRGKPYFMRILSGIGAPTDPRLGVDFSGVVESIGSDVSKFLPGDEVFGGVSGAFGDFVVISQDRAIALKPASVSFEQAASVGIAAVTALQGLRDVGQLQPGQSVLINGASGGVGTFAVQIAKAIGADVTGVCSTR